MGEQLQPSLPVANGARNLDMSPRPRSSRPYRRARNASRSRDSAAPSPPLVAPAA